MQCYVGQTGCHLHNCIQEHLGTASIIGNQIKTTSSIHKHIQQTGHCANNTCFSIISVIYQFWNITILKDSNQT